MTNSSIDFVPVGGLGNRMRAIAGGIELARQTGQPLRIVWFRDAGLGCRFNQLFLPLQHEGVSLREASPADYLLLDRPRPRNLFIPRLYQRLAYDLRIEERTTARGMYDGKNFVQWIKGHHTWMASYHYFHSLTIPQGIYAPFRPLPHLEQRIDAMARQLGDRPVGIHIRRTDHVQSIEESPTEDFIKRMKQLSPDTRFYLATDDEQEKETLRKAFPGRVFTAESKAERGSLRGMEDALVEMYILSRTSLILGSAGSSFSATAANIGGIRLEIVGGEK